MAKKKPYWVRSLLKLKPKVRRMEEEMKKRHHRSPTTVTTKTRTINVTPEMARLIYFVGSVILLILLVVTSVDVTIVTTP